MQSAGCRKRSRPKRFTEDVESPTTKKQCLIAFPTTKLSPTTSPPKKAERKRNAKKKKSNIPPLEFFIKGEHKKPPIVKPEVHVLSVQGAKSFNEIVKNVKNEDNQSKQELHPFFAKAVPKSNSFPTKSNPFGQVTKSSKENPTNRYNIDNALQPIHIQQNDKDIHTLHNFQELSLEDDFTQFSTTFSDLEMDHIISNFESSNVNKNIAPIINKCIHHNEKLILENDFKEDCLMDEIPLIPLEVYLQELKSIQQQLIQKYPSCVNLSLDDKTLLSFFNCLYFTRSSTNESNADCLTWTERYKPLQASEYFSSTGTGNKLYAWLYSWKQHLTENPEFQSSDMNAAQQELRAYKAFLIHSKDPIGKSSLVYSLARQMVCF